MSVLKTDEIGVYERDLEQNWAAAYAKRLIDELTAVVAADKAAAEAALAALASKVEDKLNTIAYPKFSISSSGDLTVSPFYALAGSVGGISSFFDNPLKDTYARGEIEGLTDALSRLGIAFADYKEYSTAPQQIGTWLDGMPVWRAAFKAPITDTMKTDKACSIFYDLSFVKSAESVKLVIGGVACIDNGSVVDNNTTTLDGFGRFNWDSINPNAEYISGYIDFVTEAENIKS